MRNGRCALAERMLIWRVSALAFQGAHRGARGAPWAGMRYLGPQNVTERVGEYTHVQDSFSSTSTHVFFFAQATTQCGCWIPFARPISSENANPRHNRACLGQHRESGSVSPLIQGSVPPLHSHQLAICSSPGHRSRPCRECCTDCWPRDGRRRRAVAWASA